MNRTLFFILLFFSYKIGLSQSSKDLQSLTSYSYYINNLVNEAGQIGVYNGSVFFIRKNQKTYLVTAKHVLSGCKNYQYKDRIAPDFLAVYLEHKSIPKMTGVQTKKIKDTSDCVTLLQC